MNKLLSSLTIFGVSLLLCGISYGADCSIYQGQIELYEDRIKEYQDAAAGYSASMASQMSAAGLSYSAIGSATSSNPYSSRINELQGELLKAKTNYNNCIYNNTLNDISNEINSLNSEYDNYRYYGPTKSEGNKACKQEFGSYSEVASDDYTQCVCMNGYTWNSSRTKCIKYTKEIADQECRDEKGANSEAKSDDYSKCVCKKGYMWNTNKTACIKYTKEMADADCKSQFGNKSVANQYDYYTCNCVDGYIFNTSKTQCVVDEYAIKLQEMLDQDKKCQDMYGEHSIYSDKCICTDGYVWNNAGTACILEETTNTMTTNTTNAYSYSDNYGYLKDYNQAYQFAYKNKITTMPTMEEANMNGEIIRAEIAKMLANWVKSLGKTPDTSKSCNFKDISGVKGDLYPAIIESCQLGIMGQGINEFRPFDKITKGEVATAVSRIIWGNKYDGGQPFYWNHMESLHKLKILDNLQQPEKNELRGNVMVMLMRASDTDELKNGNSITSDSFVKSNNGTSKSNDNPQLDIIITKQNSKIVANQDSYLDSFVFVPSNGDAEIFSIEFLFTGDFSPNNTTVRLETDNRKITAVKTVDSNGYAYLSINGFYSKLKKDEIFDATLVINTNISSGKKIGYSITSYTFNEGTTVNIVGEPNVYES